MPEISAKTKLLGVIGHPVEHSFSPAMHNAAIQALGVDWCYVAFHVLPENVGRAMDGIRGFGIRGINVTIPHKSAVMPYLDEISEEACVVGAVNTIRNDNGRLTGYNTDVYGLMTSLRCEGGLERFPAKVVLLGAGGAARAALYMLTTVEEVERIVVLNRTEARAEALAADFSDRGKEIRCMPLTGDVVAREAKDAGLMINATSAGMYPDVHLSPIGDECALPRELLVFDSVFNPRETRLMRHARTQGARAVSGLDMLVYQGARSFEIWTGLTPPVDVMKRAVSEHGHGLVTRITRIQENP